MVNSEAVTSQDKQKEAEIEALYKEIGERVRAARVRARLTQEDLGERIQMTRASVTNIETARQHIQIHTLYAVANALNVDATELLPPAQGLARGPSQHLKRVLENATNLKPDELPVLKEMLSSVTALPNSRLKQSKGRSKKSA